MIYNNRNCKTFYYLHSLSPTLTTTTIRGLLSLLGVAVVVVVAMLFGCGCKRCSAWLVNHLKTLHPSPLRHFLISPSLCGSAPVQMQLTYFALFSVCCQLGRQRMRMRCAPHKRHLFQKSAFCPLLLPLIMKRRLIIIGAGWKPALNSGFLIIS